MYNRDRLTNPINSPTKRKTAIYTRSELDQRARQLGYSIRRMEGEWRLVDDRQNAAFYFPRGIEEIGEFLRAIEA